MNLAIYRARVASTDATLVSLLRRALAEKLRCHIYSESAERLAAVDMYLWTYREDSFLPHGGDSDAFASRQPVVLSTRPENINRAHVLFLLHGTMPPADGFARLVAVMAESDHAWLHELRSLAFASGATLRILLQGEDGKWQS